MFRTLPLVYALLLCGAFPTFAHAEEPQAPRPTIQITTAVVYPLGLGTTPALLPPSIAQGVGVGVPIGNGWGYYAELGMATGFTELRPGFQVLTGPTKKFGDHFALGATVFYKIVPPYDGAVSVTHIVGGSVAPIIPLSFGGVSFPIGFAYNANTGGSSLAANIKLALRLR